MLGKIFLVFLLKRRPLIINKGIFFSFLLKTTSLARAYLEANFETLTFLTPWQFMPHLGVCFRKPKISKCSLASEEDFTSTVLELQSNVQNHRNIVWWPRLQYHPGNVQYTWGIMSTLGQYTGGGGGGTSEYTRGIS